MKYKTNKLWGAAFTKTPSVDAVAFAAGRDVVGISPADKNLIPYEIEASTAYACALFDVGLIAKKEKNALVSGLEELKQAYETGDFSLDPAKEDVQTNIESWLTEKLGIEIAGKIHTGRSRNEQCIVESILYLKAMNAVYIAEIQKLISALKQAAEKYAGVVMPGYTHHQHATVTTFGNILNAYASEFEKDVTHFQNWNDLEEVSPLGSAAGYGSTMPIDKDKINAYLKLKKSFSNPIAAITFRGDAETTFVFNVTLFMNHISSLAQTLILFSTKEFGFISISDEYSTGSSIMPQKKNPDPLEVMKAKASMCHGYLMSLLSLTKAPFIGYNRDLQWTKYVVSDVVFETKNVAAIMTATVNTFTVHKEVMLGWATHGFIFAQAIMEGLVANFNIPMRQAKVVVEKAIKQVGPNGNLTRKIINLSLSQNGFAYDITPEQYKEWTDPLTIAEKQMKKDMKGGDIT